MSALQTQQQKILEEYFRHFNTVMEHVLDLAAWNTGLRNTTHEEI